MKIKNTVLVSVVFISMCMNAQTFFKPGYVIKSVGDTLFGEVDYRGDNRMTKVCTYRHNSKDIVQHFSPDDIQGYRFKDGKYYISKVVDGKKVFLEFLINGRVNIYYSKDKRDEDHYYIEKDSLGLAEIPYEEGLRKKEGQEYLYTSTRHFGLLALYMQDAKGMQPEIMKLKKPDHNNLIALAKDYNNAVCQGNKCIIYEKKLSPIKVGFEVALGQMFVDNYILGKFNFSQAGILAHISMPLVNENLFLKTGIILPLGKQEDPLGYGFEIPFQIEYVYPHGIFRPKFAIGTNLPFLTIDLTPGVNVKLTKWLFLTANFNIGLLPYTPSDSNGFLKISRYSTSFSTGFYLNL
jgi:hypothetical protein